MDESSIPAKFQTWGDVFAHLIAHCENDPVMQVVTDPLRANKGGWRYKLVSRLHGIG